MRRDRKPFRATLKHVLGPLRTTKEAPGSDSRMDHFISSRFSVKLQVIIARQLRNLLSPPIQDVDCFRGFCVPPGV
ncbi:MAG: hypothetical protein CME32_30595 [Gimesia sp.]|nr:hypothetical protein [Gimesia sp.]